MKQKSSAELSKLTDQELIAEAKKMKNNTITNAVLIGVAIGIIIYSIIQNTWGMLTLIPVFLIYKLANSNDNKALKNELKARNLM